MRGISIGLRLLEFTEADSCFLCSRRKDRWDSSFSCFICSRRKDTWDSSFSCFICSRRKDRQNGLLVMSFLCSEYGDRQAEGDYA